VQERWLGRACHRVPCVWRKSGSATGVTLRPPYSLCRGHPGVMFSIPKGKNWGARDSPELDAVQTLPTYFGPCFRLSSDHKQPGSACLLMIITQSDLSPSYALQVPLINIVIVQGTEIRAPQAGHPTGTQWPCTTPGNTQHRGHQ